ncbi:MAG: serine hydrolase domain-containing protein, partial [Solirubrobacteraceae bacterium]
MVSLRTASRLLARLASEQSDHRLPSVVAGVVRDGELVWCAGRGRVNGGTPDADVQYRCGSITKTFVGVCVMRLRDEGLIALNDPVERFLPGTGIGGLTVAQLLSHSSGLRAETGASWWERTPGGDLAQLSADTLRGGTRFEAGRRFHYSNVGFGALGAIITAVRGAPWEDVVRGELLEPLGMGRTTPRPRAPAALGLAVHPWADLVQAEPEHDAGAMAPAGQLWTTVADLARWAAFLAGDGAGLLDPSTLAEMREPRVINDIREETWSTGYGLGLQLWNDSGARRFGHGGSMPGFLASLKVTEAGDGAVAFANATTGMSAELSGDLLGILAEEEPRLADEWVPVAPAPGVLELLGVWYWGPAPYALAARGEQLELRTPLGQGRGSRFRATGTDAWIGLDGYHTGEPLRVVRRADGSA